MTHQQPSRLAGQSFPPTQPICDYIFYPLDCRSTIIVIYELPKGLNSKCLPLHPLFGSRSGSSARAKRWADSLQKHLDLVTRGVGLFYYPGKFSFPLPIGVAQLLMYRVSPPTASPLVVAALRPPGPRLKRLSAALTQVGNNGGAVREAAGLFDEG